MLRTNKFHALAPAVLGALPAVLLLGWSSSAQAQYQIQTGHVLDANPRIGSGGYNGGGNSSYNNNINGNIWTGNVSGLNYFHGNKTVEFDPNVFQGPIGSGPSDRLNAISAPVNQAQPSNGQPNYTSYYSTDRLVGTPPTNYVPASGGQGYIPAPVIDPLTPNNDPRLELTNTDPTKGNLLTPGELDVPGPVDPSGNPSMFSMSPLYGVRPQEPDNTQSSVFNQTTNTRTLSPADRAKLTPADIQKMRDELNTTVIQPQQPGEQPSQPGNPQSPATPVTPVPGAVDLTAAQPLNSVTAPPINLSADQSLNNSSLSTQTMTGGVNSGESLQNKLIIPPAQQSKQLAELERRFAKDKQENLTDVQATDRLNEERRAQALSTAGATAKPGSAVPVPIKPGAINTAAAPKPILTTQPAVTEDNQPYIITSLATGINAKGLANLMKSGEDLMRQGKFTEAVDTYDTAEQVAPNNPFVALGRGFAEIGASYYGKADQDLSRAITADPAILAGRYDLKGFLGEDRLKFVHDDLSDIADHEKGARPLVLLGFIAHNSGDDTLATKDLDEAAKRGGYTEQVKLMRDAWKLK